MKLLIFLLKIKLKDCSVHFYNAIPRVMIDKVRFNHHVMPGL